MKYKFFGILVLMLFSVFLNVNYVGAINGISPSRPTSLVNLGATVNGNEVTLTASGNLSVSAVEPQCYDAPEFSVTYSSHSSSATSASLLITAGPTGMLNQTIPVTIAPASPSSGDCFTKAEQYTFSGSRTFTGVTAGTYTVTVKVTDDFNSISSKSVSFTIASSSFTVSASSNPPAGGNPEPVNSVVSSGSPAVFNVNANTSAGYAVVSATGCTSPLSGTGFSGSGENMQYTTGPIDRNCDVIFNYTLSTTPTLSCALDTTASPGPYYTNQGIKFEAFGGNGTYTWNTNGGTSSFELGSNNMRNWISWATTGSKIVSVTSGTQDANCGTVSIITPPPGPINGVCSDPDTHYFCSAGTSANNVEGVSAWTWNCNGLNGGTNASCSESKTAEPEPIMSGTLTASDCVIGAGSGSCTTDLNWTTTNPVATSSVTTPTSITVGTGNNSSAIYQVAYGSRNFYLYNNNVFLATDIANATCVADTIWNGSVCETTSPTEPDLTASAPTPSIATVNVVRTFSTNISNIGGGSTVNSFSNFFQVASAAGGTGTITNLTSASTPALASGATRAITSPSYTFTTTGTYSVRACADKTNPASTGTIAEIDENNNCSAWTNITVSATAGTVSGYHDAYSGTVPASQCRADGWAVYSGDLGLDVNVRILSDGTQVATGVASTYRGDLEGAGVCTGGTCSYWINLSGLISPGVNHTITAQGQNPANGAWTTLTASPKTLNCAAPTTGTLTASNCTIPSGGSSCNTSLTWTTTNPIGTSNITSNTPSANTIITTGNSGTNFSASVPYSSRTFFLNNDSVALVSVTPTATCASGTSWDGSKCAVSPPSCTDTTSFSGSVTPASVSAGGAYNLACNFGVISGYIGGSLGSGSCSWSGWSNGTQANFNCTAGGTSGSFSNSCIINYNATYPYCSRTEAVNNLTVSGGAVSGVCTNPAVHYTCATGTSTNNVSGISKFTWSCAGEGTGASASCEELKKKPIFIED